MVVCVHLPRFELVIATGGAGALVGRALAVAPTLGGERRVGEVSGATEAHGVARNMPLGEALARCPELVLVPAEPVEAAETWESVIRSLESIGAGVEPPRPGLAYFETGPLHGLHGSAAATLAAARSAAQCAGRAALDGGDLHMRLGGGPTRFCALAAALEARSRHPLAPDVRDIRRWLAVRPVGLLGLRAETEALPAPLHRLGVRTLGELVRLGRCALVDRFGTSGGFAHDLACGLDTTLRPRRVEDRLAEALDVGDASSGQALERVLGVLVDRLLARRERRGRMLRAVTLSARLLAGGGWRERVVFREALADPERIRLALSLRLLSLPAPAATLGLTVERFGPVAGEQGALLEQGRCARALRLREAVAQMRAVAGQDAALRAVCVDPDSRVPERRVVLTPLAG